MRNTKGFTLVELLVVMAIISFLTVGSFAGLTFGLRQARDTQRRTLLTSINTALLAYYADYQQYPGGDTTTPNLGCSGSATASNNFNYYHCGSAFQTTGGLLFTKGKNGLADYFEGTFNWGPIDPANANNFIGYWAGVAGSGASTARALKYGTCVALENPNGGNIVRPAGSVANVGQKDCFCLGSDYSPYACKTLQALTQ